MFARRKMRVRFRDFHRLRLRFCGGGCGLRPLAEPRLWKIKRRKKAADHSAGARIPDIPAMMAKEKSIRLAAAAEMDHVVKTRARN